jgi:putative SOS response-associated peptidase YedK
MCGRYTLSAPAGDLAQLFGVSGEDLPLQPRYNVAPTQEVAAVLADGGGRRLEMLRWGLIPRGRRTPGSGRA